MLTIASVCGLLAIEQQPDVQHARGLPRAPQFLPAGGAVAGTTAREQHASPLEAAVRGESRRTEPRVRLDGLVEVTDRLVEATDRRGENAQEVRRGAEGRDPDPGHANAESMVRREQPVEKDSASLVAEDHCGEREEGEIREPGEIPRQRGKVPRGKGLER